MARDLAQGPNDIGIDTRFPDSDVPATVRELCSGDTGGRWRQRISGVENRNLACQDRPSQLCTRATGPRTPGT